ncbi:MAG: uridine kinase [Paludibacteraceae bacterium]|nr:uridine kinase [Paludibacteraceae bacterium]
MFIIGIAGGTGSGKTTVVRKLIERLPKGEVTVIPLDSYYNDSSNVPPEERQKINFDHPNAFEWPLLIQHLQELKEGKAVEQPIYDYITSTRQQETVHVEPSEIVIVEGIMTLHHPELRDQMDLKVFVDADGDDRLIRVIKRDIVERGRTIEAVIERYQRVLKPMHEQFIEPCKRYANVIIPQGGHNNAAINMMAKFIKQQLRDHQA